MARSGNRLKRVVRRALSLGGLEVRRKGKLTGTSKASASKPSPYQRSSADNLYDAVDFLRGQRLDEMNRELVNRIRRSVTSGQRLRVAFIVNDKSKWNADSLIEEMQQVGWDTRLYLCLSNARYADRADRQAAYRAERSFFAAIDKGLVDLYDEFEDHPISPEDVVSADVVFYQQPWGMLDIPRRLAGRSLGAYLHYGFMLMANHGQHYHIGTFHAYLWRHFTQTEAHRRMHLEHDPFVHDKLVVTGYPKFDVYREPASATVAEVWPDPHVNAKRMIFAPHHSLSKGSLGMSTFAWTNEVMLDLARSTPNIQWVYKPHPLLRYKVVDAKVMTRQQYMDYEQAWQALPNATVYDTGRYFDVFRTSDALITDCGSFLAEYLPTGSPIIWLASSNSVGFNPVGSSLSEAFYAVRSIAELRETFSEIVVNGADPLKEIRRRAAEGLFPVEGRAANAIVGHLASELGASRPRR